MGITKAGPVSAGMFAAIQSKMGGVAANGVLAGVHSVAMGGIGTTALTATTVAAASATVAATAPGCRVVYRAAKKAFVGR